MSVGIDLRELAASPTLRGIGRHAPRAITAGLIVAIAWSVAQLIWQLTLPPAPVNLGPDPAPSRATPSVLRDYAGEISRLDLFGIANVKSAGVPDDAPDTQLNLKLSGIYALPDETRGMALISAGGAPEKLFKVGDTLPGNAKLSAVHPDRVVLERAGRFEALRLPTSTPGGAGRASPARAQGGAAPAVAPRAASDLGSFRQQMLQNPAKLGELVNVAPAYENNHFVGYRVSARQAHPVFDQINLQNGDIVTRVNNVTLDTPEKGIQALQQLSQAQSLSITVNRNGQVFEINHSF